jgi:hypothetical protein
LWHGISRYKHVDKRKYSKTSSGSSLSKNSGEYYSWEDKKKDMHKIVVETVDERITIKCAPSY